MTRTPLTSVRCAASRARRIVALLDRRIAAQKAAGRWAEVGRLHIERAAAVRRYAAARAQVCIHESHLRRVATEKRR